MFTFFSKKNFLVDHLEGFVDIHNHILPGIDDGAKTTEESIELIKEFSNLGIKHFIATPHIMQDYYPNNSATISKALDTLKEALSKQALENILIEAAAEHMIDSNFETLLEKKEVIPLKSEYLLIEMSYLQPSINFETAIDRVKSSGYFPILAHPERYVFLFSQNRKYIEYKNQGILFQLNLLSLGDFYGLEVKKAAMKILSNGQVDFLGTDVHHMNHIRALKEIKMTKKTLELILPVMERTIQYFF